MSYYFFKPYTKHFKMNKVNFVTELNFRKFQYCYVTGQTVMTGLIN